MKVTAPGLLFIIAQLYFCSILLWPAIAADPCWATLAAEGDEVCLVRGLNYSKDMFNHVSGCYCYYYMNSALFKPNITIRKIHVNESGIVYPCILFPEDMTVLPYLHTNPKTVQVLGDTFVSSDGLNKWIQCSKSAISCCRNMNDNDVHPGEGYCPMNWDGWSCWDKARVNTTQHLPCPDFIYSAEKPSCQQYSSNKCWYTGKWNHSTDYLPCSRHHISQLRNRTSYHVIWLFVSSIASLPALIIFFSYKKLRVTRVTLHRNLILSIIVRNSFSIAVKVVIILDAISDKSDDVMVTNSAWCRTLSFMDKLAGSAVYTCMLLEGIFLHRLIAAAFKGEPKMILYYCAGSGFTILPLVIWAIITALYNDVNCWAADTTNYGYIVDGPRIFTLGVNALLMLDIVRVLCTKLRKINTVRSVQIRRMTRATILLIPLFGVQFLLTLVRPNTQDCDLEQLYYYFFYTMDGLQGIFVALFYCYLNKEVHVQVLRSYNMLMASLYRLFGKDYEPKHRPTWAYSEHRQTASSFVTPYDVPRTRASSPSGTDGEMRSHTRSSRPSLVGNVNDILSQQNGAQSPTARLPSRSMPFPRGSLKSDGSPNRSHFVQSAQRRKVSTVSEGSLAEDGTDQTQWPSAVTSTSHSKDHNSDDEVHGSNPAPCTAVPEDMRAL